MHPKENIAYRNKPTSVECCRIAPMDMVSSVVESALLILQTTCALIILLFTVFGDALHGFL